jgi:succinate dehydrogenase/fumarate reductase flavoprotein subunit
MLVAFIAALEPIITELEPVVRGPPPPPPPPAGLGWLPFLFLALSFAWWIARKWTRPGTKRAARVVVFGAAIGNALRDVAAMLQPERATAAEIQRIRETPKAGESPEP